MPDNGQVQFEEEVLTRRIPQRTTTSRLIMWVMNHSGGLITSEEQAYRVLLGIAVVGIIIAVVLAFAGGPDSPASGAVPASQDVPY